MDLQELGCQYFFSNLETRRWHGFHRFYLELRFYVSVHFMQLVLPLTQDYISAVRRLKYILTRTICSVKVMLYLLGITTSMHRLHFR